MAYSPSKKFDSGETLTAAKMNDIIEGINSKATITDLTGGIITVNKATGDKNGADITSTYVKASDIVNNLTSGVTTKALSAEQGKVLASAVNSASPKLYAHYIRLWNSNGSVSIICTIINTKPEAYAENVVTAANVDALIAAIHKFASTTTNSHIQCSGILWVGNGAIVLSGVRGGMPGAIGVTGINLNTGGFHDFENLTKSNFTNGFDNVRNLAAVEV